jgi:tRNA modification GTPase
VIETAVVLGGWSVVLVDTAGLRDRDSEASGATERAGIARALAAAAAADLVVEVVEVGEPVPEPAGLVVWSKADQWPGVVVPAGVIATSSRSGAGIVDLVGAVIAQLIPEAGEPGLLDGAVPFLPRHLELLDRLLGADPGGQSPAIQ